jgi:hypothetical protein
MARLSRLVATVPNSARPVGVTVAAERFRYPLVLTLLATEDGLALALARIETVLFRGIVLELRPADLTLRQLFAPL